MTLAALAVIQGTVHIFLGQLVMTLHTNSRLFVGQFVGVFLDIDSFVACFSTAFTYGIMYNRLLGVFCMTFFRDASILLGLRLFHGKSIR